MRKSRELIYALAFGLLAVPVLGQSIAAPDAGLAPVRPNQPLITNALLGYVDAEPVFATDILQPLDEQLRNLANAGNTSLADFKTQAGRMILNQINDHIDSALMLSNAESALTDDDKSRLEPVMNLRRTDLLAKYGGSRAVADEALRAQGTSVDKTLADMRRREIVELLRHKELISKIEITRKMVYNQYQRTPKTWQKQAELELFTITLPVSRWLPHDAVPGQPGAIGPVTKNPTAAQIAQARATALKTADDIVAQLKGGADFGELAQSNDSVDGRARYGGRTPNVIRGTLLNRQEEDYAFSLPAHTLGQPLVLNGPDPLNDKVVVIRVGDKKEARTIPFTEAQTQIIKDLQNQQFDALYAAYIDKLRKNSSADEPSFMADLALDVAIARYATR